MWNCFEKDTDCGVKVAASSRRQQSINGILLFMKRKMGFIIGGGLTVIAAVVAAAALGYLYGGVKTPEQRALVYYNVCGNDIIDKFNGSISSPDNLKKISGEIEKKNH